MNNKNKAYLSIFGVFISGLIVGSICALLYIKSKVDNIQSLRNSKGFEKYIFANLNVDESKQDSLRNLLNKSYQEISDLRNSTSNKYHIILDSLNSRLAPNLDSTQFNLLKKNTSKLHEMVKQSLENNKEISQSYSKREVLTSKPILENKSTITPNIIPKTNSIDSVNLNKNRINSKDIKIKSDQNKLKIDSTVKLVKADTSKLKLYKDEEVNSFEKGGVNHFKEIINQLNANKNQLDLINAIILNAKNNLVGLKRDNYDTPFIFKQKRKIIISETKMKIIQILNEDQKIKFRTLLNSRRNNLNWNGETGVK